MVAVPVPCRGQQVRRGFYSPALRPGDQFWPIDVDPGWSRSWSRRRLVEVGARARRGLPLRQRGALDAGRHPEAAGRAPTTAKACVKPLAARRQSRGHRCAHGPARSARALGGTLVRWMSPRQLSSPPPPRPARSDRPLLRESAPAKDQPSAAATGKGRRRGAGGGRPVRRGSDPPTFPRRVPRPWPAPRITPLQPAARRRRLWPHRRRRRAAAVGGHLPRPRAARARPHDAGGRLEAQGGVRAPSGAAPRLRRHCCPRGRGAAPPGPLQAFPAEFSDRTTSQVLPRGRRVGLSDQRRLSIFRPRRAPRVLASLSPPSPFGRRQRNAPQRFEAGADRQADALLYYQLHPAPAGGWARARRNRRTGRVY